MFKALSHRRRVLFWLIKAYYKKRKKTIFTFFFAGIFFAGLLYFFLPYFFATVHLEKTKTIGVVGSYTLEALPQEIQEKMSLGLTKITEDGGASPSASAYYESSSDGKQYTFTLRNDLTWQDGKRFVAADVNYNFKDVQAKVVDIDKITFTLKDPYAPFPTVLSKPLFQKGLVGLQNTNPNTADGTYKIADIKKNGSVLTSITLQGDTDLTKDTQQIYKFYPNEEIGKTAFKLGEIQTLENISDIQEFKDWKTITIQKQTAYDQLVTIFFNTTFPLFSNDNKSIRQALNYAIPRDFQDTIQANSPLNKLSWAYMPQKKYTYNIDLANQLLKLDKTASNSPELAVTLTTTPRFKDLAKKVKDAWNQVAVRTTINIVQTIPSDPQAFLEAFKIPADPDQYILWHSTQSTNISHYANPKIDKLLEDGRQTSNREQRQDIYHDFQKYLMDDAPAAFLYYPTVYTVTRK